MSDFNKSVTKVQVIDSRVSQKDPVFNVFKGASQILSQPTSANSSSTSSLNFTVQVPSTDSYMDRSIELTAESIRKVVFTYTAGAVTGTGDTICDFGNNLSLPAFPLQQEMENINININGTSVSQRQNRVINELLRMSNMKKNHLQRGCPTQLDKYGKNTEALNCLGGYETAFDSDNVPNGAFTNVSWCDVNGAPVGPPKILTNAQITTTAYYKFKSTEKLVLSPFIFSEDKDDSVGLFGLQTFTVLCTLSTDLSRSLRFFDNLTNRNVVITSIGYANPAKAWESAVINSIFRAPAIGQPQPQRSIVPYMHVSDFETITNQTVAAGAQNVQIRSGTSTLSQIPDYLLIYVKPKNLAANYGDNYLPITGLNMSFLGQGGILSSMTGYQLFETSVRNGLNMDFNQYFGSAHTNNSNGSKSILTGGFIILRPGIDIELPAQYAAGCPGNFSIQVTATVNNQLDIQVDSLSLTLGYIYSGFFITENGKSATLLGPVDVQEVANMTKAGPQYQTLDSQELSRMVGGSSFWSKLASGVKQVASLPVVKDITKIGKELARNSGNPQLEMAATAADLVGLGRTTGGKRKGLHNMVFNQ